MSGPAVSAPSGQSGAAAGEQLRGERERRGLTVQQVAETLHLDIWAIEAMEAGRFAALGPPVYSRGHLNKYASLLGLDARALCVLYDEKHVPEPALAPLKPAMQAERSRAPMMVLVAAGLVGAAALGWTLWPDRVSGPAVAETPVVEKQSSMAVVAAAEANEQPGNVMPAATAPSPGASTSNVELRLTYKADCWTEVYNAAGERLLYDTGLKNSERTVKGAGPLRVFVGNTDGVDLQANGKPLRMPADLIRGGVARFAVSADGKAARWVSVRE